MWPFLALFLFRYIRLVGTIISYTLSKPIPLPINPRYTPRDVSVIIPTVDPSNPALLETIISILATHPHSIIISTVGSSNLSLLQLLCLRLLHTDTRIVTCSVPTASKRAQIAQGLKHVTTRIAALCDDHVFWPSTFLLHMLAPFEDPRIGAVGPTRRVRRSTTHPRFFLQDIFNYLACVHIARRNVELLATNAIDGGVYCLPGSTIMIRSAILQDADFLTKFLNEYIALPSKERKIGPLNVDDDCFTTRYLVRHGWEIAIQSGEEATLETTLGEYPKYLAQCLRWARTYWRTTPRSLFCAETRRLQLWSWYAIHLYFFLQFGLLYDGALLYFFWSWQHSSAGMFSLAFFMLVGRLVKLVPYHVAHPCDIVYIPAAIVFAYAHSAIKLFALGTFWNIGWSGRRLEGEEE